MRSETIPEFLAALEKPRRVLIMVKAGDPTDAVINELADAMEEGDIIIDGGNALYTDTIRREKAIRERGLHFVGAGISGGEEGALNGPSIMPGGPPSRTVARPAARGDLRARRRRAVLHPHRPRRRRPLRQDGAQRHRVLRHAADRRGLPTAARRVGHERAADRRGVHRVEQGRPGQLPRRDHRRGAAPDRRQDRQAAGRRDPRRGRAEGHRSLDGQVRARPGCARHRYRRGRVRPCAVGLGGPAQGHHRAGLRRPRRKAERRSAVHRGRPSGAVRVEDHRLRPGLQPDPGRQHEYDWGITPGDMATIWRGGCIIRAKFLNRIKEAFDRIRSCRL